VSKEVSIPPTQLGSPRHRAEEENNKVREYAWCLKENGKDDEKRRESS